MSNQGLDDYFGKTLKKLRKDRGLSLSELAEKSGVSGSYLNRLEKSIRKTPNFMSVIEIARALDVGVDYLTGVNLHKKETYSLQDFILINPLEYGGRLLSIQEKQALYNIMEMAFDAEWTIETMLLEIKHIGEQISILKKCV